jgi:hypothetical protein
MKRHKMEVKILQGDSRYDIVDFVSEQYIANNLINPEDIDLVITSTILDKKSIPIAAIEENQIIAAACVNIDNKTAYVSSLASKSRAAVLGVFVEIGKIVLAKGVEKLTAIVHPKYAKFYSRVIGAKVSDKVFNVELVNNAPGVELELEINEENLAKLRGWKTRVIDDIRQTNREV